MLRKSSTYSCLMNRMQDKSFEDLEQFRCLGTTLTSAGTHKIKSILNSGNACYHSVQNLWYSRLLSENITFKMYRTIICLLSGCETLFLRFREECGLKVLENGVLMMICGT
jgi:hypothetical protein